MIEVQISMMIHISTMFMITRTGIQLTTRNKAFNNAALQ